MWLSDEEQAVVVGAAEQLGMAAGSWLGEIGVRSARLDSPVRVGGGPSGGAVALELMALQAQLVEVRRVLRNVGGNLNDVARVANSTGEVAAETATVARLVARVVARVEDTVAYTDAGLATILGGPARRTRTGRTRPGSDVRVSADTGGADGGEDDRGIGRDADRDRRTSRGHGWADGRADGHDDGCERRRP